MERRNNRKEERNKRMEKITKENTLFIQFVQNKLDIK